MDPLAPTSSPELSTGELLTVWQVVADRRASYDSMMWQTPSLGMTAQAFLLTLSLSDGTSGTARVLAAGLSVMISLMVVQLLAKHRRNEFLDSLALEAIEARLDLAGLAGFHPHTKDRYPVEHLDKVDASGRGVLIGPRKFWDMSSFALWCFGQYAFIVVAVAIILLVTTGFSGALNP